MSSGQQVALLPPLGRREMAPRLRTEAPPARPLARVVAFAALAAYGVERWATLERGAPGWRLLGLLALSAGATLLVARRVLREPVVAGLREE